MSKKERADGGIGRREERAAVRVIFVCLGNICRSPMAEILFRDMLEKAGWSDRVAVSSRATEPYEEGEGVYPPAARELKKHGFSAEGKRSVMLRKEERDADYILCMDRENLRDCARILGTDAGQYLLMSFTGRDEEVADPWYTGDFRRAYEQIAEGCEAFFAHLRRQWTQTEGISGT